LWPIFLDILFPLLVYSGHLKASLVTLNDGSTIGELPQVGINKGSERASLLEAFDDNRVEK
jgi:hypothetical protein